ncbi:LLM class flavin-dependent oxidoreductase [Naasia sp. SYSU D00057]|uniref:LLM class flavin-dependent oxidoreductase n=1 Tax=Naasia sp. SYSU D00057 TaxID=2817380 RepID=UPI001B30F8B1|nr:LLM class flavin-dependent oxidoreductase [Naasia sp. SYSU D00057]
MFSPLPIGVMLPRDLSASDVLHFARSAEAAGAAELWVVEDLGFRGGIAQAGAVLAATTSLRVGIGILPAAVRNPVYLAMELATLAQLFPGRIDAGIGHGMPGWLRQIDAWPWRPLALLEQTLITVRRLLAGEEAGGARLDPAAVPMAPPPLLAGVRGPRSLAVAGRLADGTVLAEPVTPEYATASLAQIKARVPHRLVAYNVASVDDDERKAFAAARPALAWIGEPDWDVHVADLIFADEFRALRAVADGPEDFARQLPDAWVAELALAGTAQRVRNRLTALRNAGVTEVVLQPTPSSPFAAIDALHALA